TWIAVGLASSSAVMAEVQAILCSSAAPAMMKAQQLLTNSPASVHLNSQSQLKRQPKSGLVPSRRVLIGCLPLILLMASCSSRTTEQALQNRGRDRQAVLEIDDPNGLINQLSQVDEARRPKAITQPDGSIQYRYFSNGGPEPTAQELEAEIASPRDLSQHRQDILGILERLKRIGVSVVIEAPQSHGAGGTWSHADRRLTLSPSIVQQGTLEFHETLSHEAVHVAQSCYAGSITAVPARLGLIIKYWPTIESALNHPLYSSNKEEAQLIEREAYSQSQEVGLALALLSQYCKPK
ncbi:MAG: hypothetical protein ACO3X1_16525, partial [Burkholderiaceae bacterium]